MGKRLREVEAGKWLALAGAILTFLHGFIELVKPGSATESSTFSEVMRLVGIGIFLAGVWITLRQVISGLDRITEAHQAALESLSVAENNRRLAEIEAWLHQNPDGMHVRAASGVASHLLQAYVPQLIRRVQEFCDAPQAGGELHVEEQSPVHDLLANMAAGLPEGGFWLGITLLEHEKIWIEPDDAFSRFAETIRNRAKTGAINVARIYHFTDREAGAGLVQVVNRELGAKVHIRCLAGGVRQDLSILYAPPDDETRRICPPFEDDVVEQLDNAGYQLLCAVRFTTRDDGVLRGAWLYKPGHNSTRELVGRFRSRWMSARPQEDQP